MKSNKSSWSSIVNNYKNYKIQKKKKTYESQDVETKKIIRTARINNFGIIKNKKK